MVIADTVRSAEADRISHQRLDQAALGRAVAKAVIAVGGGRAGDAAAKRSGWRSPPRPAR